MRTTSFIVVCSKNGGRLISDFAPKELQDFAVYWYKAEKDSPFYWEKHPEGEGIKILYRDLELFVKFSDVPEKNAKLIEYLKTNPVYDFQLFYERWLSIPNNDIMKKLWKGDIYIDKNDFKWNLYYIDDYITEIRELLIKIGFNPYIALMIRKILEKNTLYEQAAFICKKIMEKKAYCILESHLQEIIDGVPYWLIEQFVKDLKFFRNYLSDVYKHIQGGKNNE
ncbi:hypothetical protein [Persephonella sp.]